MVRLTPKDETARHIIANDLPFSQQVAQQRGRYRLYKCG